MKKWTGIFYRYHRWFGLLVGIPMILWTISGICHPLMANFFAKPIARSFYPAIEIPLSQMTQSIRQVLIQNQYDSIEGFRIVLLDNTPHYQIRDKGGRLSYFSCTTGDPYPDGDYAHAEMLARWFLNDQMSALLEVERVDQFNGEYGLINRFLPAYRVRLDDPEQTDVYVDLSGDRLATYNDGYRRAFLWCFSNLHSWSFLGDREGPFRVSVVVLFSLFTMGVSISGIHLFAFMKRKRSSSRALQWHRWLGIIFSIFLLGFSSSALMVALPKYRVDTDNRMIATPRIFVSDLPDTLLQILPRLSQPVYDISLVTLQNRLYYRFETCDENRERQVSYLDVEKGSELGEGDLLYARDLFQRISGHAESSLIEVNPLTRFSNEYPFIMKRLPVYKMVSSDAPAGSAWYIETRTGFLAAQKTLASTTSGIGFILLHKFHFLDPLGKDFRDTVIIAVSLFLLIVSVLGVFSWFRS
jgi:hypothetical protein